MVLEVLAASRGKENPRLKASPLIETRKLGLHETKRFATLRHGLLRKTPVEGIDQDKLLRNDAKTLVDLSQSNQTATSDYNRMHEILKKAYRADPILCDYLLVHMLHPNPNKRPNIDQVREFVTRHAPRAGERQAAQERLKSASQKRVDFNDWIRKLEEYRKTALELRS